jgi:hypothetical protein
VGLNVAQANRWDQLCIYSQEYRKKERCLEWGFGFIMFSTGMNQFFLKALAFAMTPRMSKLAQRSHFGHAINLHALLKGARRRRR